MLCIISVSQIDERKWEIKLLISFVCLCTQYSHQHISHGICHWVLLCSGRYVQHLLQSPPSGNKVPMMKLCVTSPPPHFAPVSPQPCCQNSDRGMRVWARVDLSSAVRKPTALCANHNPRHLPPHYHHHHHHRHLWSGRNKIQCQGKKAERHHSDTTIHGTNKPPTAIYQQTQLEKEPSQPINL